MKHVLAGKMGRAERAAQDDQEPMKSAGVAAWLIWAKDENHDEEPFFLSVARLAGRPYYEKDFPDASHHIALFRMIQGSSPKANNRRTLSLLLPFEFHMQVTATDDQAESLGLHLVKAVLQGLLPARTRSYVNGEESWEESVHATLEHIVTGGHYKKVVSG